MSNTKLRKTNHKLNRQKYSICHDQAMLIPQKRKLFHIESNENPKQDLKDDRKGKK